MPINSFLYPVPSNSDNFEVSNSCRFDGSSDYLNRTPSSAGNLRTMTFSFWMKRAKLEQDAQRIFSIFNNGGADQFWLRTADSSNDYIDFFSQSSSSQTLRLVSNARLRDLSAWYHIVIAVDTTQGTDSNRIKMYINGVQQTSFSTTSYPSQNTDLEWNKAIPNMIGAQQSGGSSEFIDMYLAEVCFIDGQQLAADQFGEFDSDNPTIWKPKEILTQLDFGANGFYLQFKNASSLGTDSSTNGNDFTVNNLTSIDQTTDTCTNNFATLNPLDFTGSITASEGNTVFQGGRYKATIGVSSGKWYWEAKRLNAPDNAYIGIKADDGDWNNSWNNSYTYYTFNGNYYLNGSNQGSYGSSSTTNDILMFALDMDNGKFYIGENGTFYNSGDPAAGSNPMASSISGTYLPAVINNSSSGTDQYSFNFGNPSFTISSGNSDANGHGNFEYAVPSGYFALCTKNLAEFG
tara:strand:+ start:68 stop:1453 length:1386 start_codon:yes stop_codon:yes gene_type:complete